MRTVSITGSTGFVGTNLIQMFKNKGFKTIRIKRSDIKNIDRLKKIVEESDLIINLAGANIINRWSESYKKVLYSSRIETTKALVEAMIIADKQPKLFISTSAIGVYKNKECYSENDFEFEDDFLANLCKKWENTALRIQNFGVRVAIFRFGIVMGNGGALEKMLTPFKLGLGGTIGNGKQDFSFIHIEDLLRAYEFIYENNNLSGIFNLTAPSPTTNLGLTKALGKTLGRPTILPLPNFILNFIFSEGAKVLTDGQCVKPQRLIENGFKFKYKTIDETIDNLVG